MDLVKLLELRVHGLEQPGQQEHTNETPKKDEETEEESIPSGTAAASTVRSRDVSAAREARRAAKHPVLLMMEQDKDADIEDAEKDADL